MAGCTLALSVAWQVASPTAACAAEPSPGEVSSPTGSALELGDVLRSVEATYPPLLAARIEREVREGRLRSATSIYDFDIFGSIKNNVDGYYEYSVAEAGGEQFLGAWGSSVYGGYRLSSGELLPDYYFDRTQEGGAATLGFQLSLLAGRATDSDRGNLRQARIDLELVRPLVDRQALTFRRDGTVAYFKWLASGLKLRLARELLRLAQDRTNALEEQVRGGLHAEIVLVDNRRLVVSRELAVVEAERDFEVAALSLSLFYRDARGNPIVVGEDRLPAAFPAERSQPGPLHPSTLEAARQTRPEVALLLLELERLEVDEEVARNSLLPKLDATVEASEQFGEEIYRDREGELAVGLKFQLPVQRRKAEGKLAQTRAKIRQLERKLDFLDEKIVAEVRKAEVALEAAWQQIQRAELNVELARQLEAAERESFRLGASDLLALQLREQASFDAQKKAVDAVLGYFVAQADQRAATAEGL